MSSVCVAPFIAIALLGQALPDEAKLANFSGQVFGKEYAVTMTYGAIKKTPDWGDAEENPPVSAKKAVKLATAMKDLLLKDTKGAKMELGTLSLIKFEGKWIWLVTFVPEKEGSPSELQQAIELQEDFPQLTLPVLMDGTVIKPIFKEE